MGRLIVVSNLPTLQSPLTLRVGDVIHFHATGGRIRPPAEALEMLGAYVGSTISDAGQVIAPMSAPNQVLFRARQAGRATIEVVTGDPWRAPQTTTVTVIVEE